MQNSSTLMGISFYAIPNFDIMITANFCTWHHSIPVRNFVSNDLVASIWVAEFPIKIELHVKSWMACPHPCEMLNKLNKALWWSIWGLIIVWDKMCGIKSLRNEPVHNTCCSLGGFLSFHVTNLDQQINSVSLSTPTRDRINLFGLIITWIYLAIRMITNKKVPIMQMYFVLEICFLSQLQRSLCKCVTEHPGYCTQLQSSLYHIFTEQLGIVLLYLSNNSREGCLPWICLRNCYYVSNNIEHQSIIVMQICLI